VALNQVAARVEGDVFQGRFFWHQACALLLPNRKVIRVAFEHDEASGADDVAVFYEPPGVRDGIGYSEADFFQCKYHVDQRDCYSSEAFIDPAFISQTSRSSLLQRLHGAYGKLRLKYKFFRLHFISNWTWRPDDPVATSIYEREGSLPEAFFQQSPKVALGTVRESWRRHLCIDETEFLDFARKLRFGLNYFGRRWFMENLNDRLELCGLQPVTAGQLTNSYDSLYTNFLLSKQNDFDRDRLLGICRAEGLVLERAEGRGVKIIGVRSLMKFAERMEDETDDFVCVAEHFERRYIRHPDLWNEKVVPTIVSYLSSPPCGRSTEMHLLLDCHSSLAFLAGYCMERKGGIPAYPIQKGRGKELWKPSYGPKRDEWKWSVEESQISGADPDIALMLSVTHDVGKDAGRFMKSANLKVGKVVHLRPVVGVGPSVLLGADHAYCLAEEAMAIIRKANEAGGTTHVFVAAPNALMFFLGQYGAALKRVQLYEFDFDGEKDGSYSASLCLP
jgi:hypothetical protein